MAFFGRSFKSVGLFCCCSSGTCPSFVCAAALRRADRRREFEAPPTAAGTGGCASGGGGRGIGIEREVPARCLTRAGCFFVVLETRFALHGCSTASGVLAFCNLEDRRTIVTGFCLCRGCVFQKGSGCSDCSTING